VQPDPNTNQDDELVIKVDKIKRKEHNESNDEYSKESKFHFK